MAGDSPKSLVVCLALTLLLAGLHLAVIVQGFLYYGSSRPALTIAPDGTNYSAKDFKQLGYFLAMGSVLTSAISVVLWTDKFSLSLYIKHILICLNLVVGFALTVNLAFSAYQASNLLELRDMLDPQL